MCDRHTSKLGKQLPLTTSHWDMAAATYLRVLLAVNLVLVTAGTVAAIATGPQLVFLTSLFISLVLFDASFIICGALLSRGGKSMPTPTENYVESGIPSASRVAIMVPVLLHSAAQTEKILRTARWNLQMANDSSVFLLVIYDFRDGKSQHLDESENLLKLHFEQRIKDLAEDMDKRYGSCIHGMYRHRMYSERDEVWMGRERKRGKIDLINSLIEGAETKDSFEASEESLLLLRGTKYVLVLDEDSKLTPNTVQHLVGFLDHPSNRPVIRDGDIVEGHALVCCQSIIEASSLARWRMSRAISGPRADPAEVARPSYDFFYDWFGASRYTGKGLYNVKAYRSVCNNSIPDGLILSHDTIEAARLRGGFSPHGAITDRFPTSHKAMLARAARWMRGDIQNFYFATKKCMSREAFGTKGRLSVPGQLMLLQQLASLLNALFMLPLVALLIFRGAPLMQLLLILGITGINSYIRVAQNIVRDVKRRRPTQFWFSVYPGYIFRIHFSIFYKIFIAPAMFCVAMEAVWHAATNLVRGKGLLRWDSAEAVESGMVGEDGANRLILAGGIGLSLMLSLILVGSTALFGYLIAATWLLTPMIDCFFIRRGTGDAPVGR